MSRILVAVSPFPGHANPILLVAEHLSRQGHQVVFNCSEAFREKVKAAGLNFAPLLRSANYDYRLLDEVFPERLAVPEGLSRVDYDVQHIFGGVIPDQYEGLLELIEEYEIDLVLIDLAFYGALPLMLGDKPRPPVVTCGVLPYFLKRPGVSPFTGPNTTPEGMLQNAKDDLIFEGALSGSTTSINQILGRYGISPVEDLPLHAVVKKSDIYLQFTAEEFEYPIPDKAGNLQFIGPLVPKIIDQTEAPKWLKSIDGSRPVLFVTQGTLANEDFGQLVGPTIEAFAGEDVEVIVTGGGGDVSGLKRSPNVHIERYLPYHLVLPKTDVFITNGGYNGVQQALSFGVPVVAGGATEDKPFVCARVAWSGTGIDLKTANPTPQQVKDAVKQILEKPQYRERAREMEKVFAQHNALETVVKVIEATIADSAWRKSERSEENETVLD